MNHANFNVTICVRLPEDLAQRLDKIASNAPAFNRPTRPAVMREALQQFLDRHDAQVRTAEH